MIGTIVEEDQTPLLRKQQKPSLEESPLKPKPKPKKSLAEIFREKVQDASSFIEQPNVVIIFLLIVYLDIVLESISHSSGGIISARVHVLRDIILDLQCTELILQMVLFRIRFFSHWGYCFDTVLVGMKVFNGHYFDVKPHHLHILSFLRVWRFVHVVQSYLSIEISRHARTKDELSSQVKSFEDWKCDVEREKRLAMEETDTLREALKFAALEVAAMNATVKS